MSENQEEKPQEAAEEKKSKLLPILFGVLLVVGAAVGTVAFVLPPKEAEQAPPPISEFQQVLHPEKWSVRWPVESKIGQIEFKFMYRTRDPLWAEKTIADRSDMLVAKVLRHLSERTAQEVGGLTGLTSALRTVVEDAVFPEAKEALNESEKMAIVSDILILNYLPPRR